MGKEFSGLAEQFIKNLVGWLMNINVLRDYKPFGIAIVFYSPREKKHFSITYDVPNEKFGYVNKEINFDQSNEQ